MVTWYCARCYRQYWQTTFYFPRRRFHPVIILPKRGLTKVTCCFAGLWEIEKARRASCGPRAKTTDYFQCLPLPLPGFVLVSVVKTIFTTSTVPLARSLPWMVTL